MRVRYVAERWGTLNKFCVSHGARGTSRRLRLLRPITADFSSAKRGLSFHFSSFRVRQRLQRGKARFFCWTSSSSPLSIANNPFAPPPVPGVSFCTLHMTVAMMQTTASRNKNPDMAPFLDEHRRACCAYEDSRTTATFKNSANDATNVAQTLSFALVREWLNGSFPSAAVDISIWNQLVMRLPKPMCGYAWSGLPRTQSHQWPTARGSS